MSILAGFGLGHQFWVLLGRKSFRDHCRHDGDATGSASDDSAPTARLTRQLSHP